MNDLTLLIPEFLLTALAFVVLGADLFLSDRRKQILPALAVAGLVGVGAVLLLTTTRGEVGSLYQQLIADELSLYGGSLVFDGYSLVFKVFFVALGVVVVLSSVEYVKRHLQHPGEYYGILLFTVLAMMLMASSRELLTAYISLELLSFGLYVLVSFDRYNPKSNEAGTKYILLGAFSSALMLYGISQVYGLLGTTRFEEIGAVLSQTPDPGLGVQVGLALLVVGLAFKVAAVPFHMWAPDAYEGAPVPITAYLAVGSKAAAFALIVRLFIDGLVPAHGDLQVVMAVLAALTMVLGNLVALVQTNIKRLLAYSSVGHVGYLLLGVAALAALDAGGSAGAGRGIDGYALVVSGIMLHIVAYAVTNMAAFLCVSTVYDATGREDTAAYSGLASRSPGLAMVMAASLFSLAGLPIFAGFVSKFYLFNAAAYSGLLWLAGLAIAASLISLYYYLMVIKRMYVDAADDETKLKVPRLTTAVFAVLFAGTILLGVYPAPLMLAIDYASDTLLLLSPLY